MFLDVMDSALFMLASIDHVRFAGGVEPLVGLRSAEGAASDPDWLTLRLRRKAYASPSPLPPCGRYGGRSIGGATDKVDDSAHLWGEENASESLANRRDPHTIERAESSATSLFSTPVENAIRSGGSNEMLYVFSFCSCLVLDDGGCVPDGTGDRVAD